MSSASKKRKIAEVTTVKYYAVRAGHTPGVYTSWSDCQLNTTGFKGAQCKLLANLFKLGVVLPDHWVKS